MLNVFNGSESEKKTPAVDTAVENVDEANSSTCIRRKNAGLNKDLLQLSGHQTEMPEMVAVLLELCSFFAIILLEKSLRFAKWLVIAV